MKKISEYIICAQTCEETDYSNKASVKKHNQSVNKMYVIIEEANTTGDVEEFYPLLNHPIASKWLALHIVEKTNADQKIKKKCISIVEELASKDSVEAMGEQMWLKEWK